MANIRLSSPLARFMYRPFMADFDEEWPEMSVDSGLDVYEEGDKVIVEAPVPGVPAENVDIEYENGVLHIRAHFEESKEEKEKKKVVYKQERVSSFNYSTTLPRPVDPKSIEATVSDGVVMIRAKIAEEAKRKKIPVKAAK